MPKRRLEARQRLVEIALCQSELRYRTMVEQLGEAVCRWMPDTTLTFVNDTYCRILGEKREDLLGYSWVAKTAAPAERSKMKAFYASLARHPRIISHEEEIATPGGRRYWFFWKDIPLFDRNGHLFEFQSIGHDITARKRYEETLARKEEALKALLNNIPDVAWLKDKKGHLMAVNEPFAKACNIPREELIGKTDLDVWPKALAQRYRRNDLLVMRTRTRMLMEGPLADPRGHIRWYETVKTPIVDPQGCVVGTAGIARDVTETKNLLDKFKSGEVALRRALALKDALVRDLHDRIIQSLYAVGLGLEDGRRAIPSGGAKALRCLRGSVEGLNAVIGELRAFIVDAQKDDGLIKTADLSREIRAFVKRVRANRSLRIHCRLSGEACRNIGPHRAGHVYSIIREAVSNSLRHARARTIWVAIGQDHGSIWIRIRDDGVGLKRPGRGRVHFGLKNMKARVDEMAGCLTIESTVGKGTSIRVVLNGRG